MNINTVHLTFVYNISHDTSLIWFSDRILDSIQFPYFYYISKSHSTIKSMNGWVCSAAMEGLSSTSRSWGSFPSTRKQQIKTTMGILALFSNNFYISSLITIILLFENGLGICIPKYIVRVFKS